MREVMQVKDCEIDQVEECERSGYCKKCLVEECDKGQIENYRRSQVWSCQFKESE